MAINSNGDGISRIRRSDGGTRSNTFIYNVVLSVPALNLAIILKRVESSYCKNTSEYTEELTAAITIYFGPPSLYFVANSLDTSCLS